MKFWAIKGNSKEAARKTKAAASAAAIDDRAIAAFRNLGKKMKQIALWIGSDL